MSNTPYYQDKRVQLWHGDCADVMPTLIPESVGMVLADLPFGTTRNDWDTVIDPKTLWWNYDRLLPKRGPVVLFGAGIFTAEMMMSNRKHWRYNLVWDKQAVSNPMLAKLQPMRAHEDVLVFYRRQPVYHPQMVPTARKAHGRGTRVDRTVNHYNAFSNTPVVEQQGQYPRSILSFKRPKEGLHPNQKPLDMCEWLIRTYTDPNATVLDNVAGSGTTLLAAANSGRYGIGIEAREDYCEVAARRLSNRTEPTGAHIG